MALILAIEPDRRQAAQLVRLIQTRVGAELVLAETTEQALGAIGNRVPDLVLVPALLAPQDDATLATALRVIASAAHVQMLTIPMLAPKRAAGQPLGVLARLRRRRADPTPPDGCDPDVFGDQIAAYLAEAAAERAITESDLAIELSTLNATDSTNAHEFSQESPDLSVHVVLGVEPSSEELTADLSFSALEPAVEPATVVFEVENALFTSTTEGAAYLGQDSPDLTVHAVSGEGALDAPIGDEPSIAAIDAFTLTEADSERALVEGGLGGTPVVSATKDTKDTKEFSEDDSDLCIPRVLDGELVVIEAVELAATLDLTVTSDNEPGAFLVSPQPRHVSEAPWFGPLRRWPDLEGEETLDPLAVLAVEDSIDGDIQTQTAFAPAAESAAIEDLPTVLAAVVESAAVLVEETPVGVQDALPQIDTMLDTMLIEEPAPSAVPELWMPLTLHSASSWPALEGVWSEARPDPPAVVHADPPAVVAAPLAPAPAAERVPPQDAAPARPEWIELIESLRQDVKRLRSERTQAPVAEPRIKGVPTPVARTSPTVRRAAVADVEPTPQTRAKTAKPAQDEWGFFDPEQCGFAALLAKLDEITQVNDGA